MDGSRIVTPSRMCSSLRRTRRFHSAAASCERSLMPSKRPSSSKATAVTSRPSSRARRTSSVRYSSPVVGDGSSDSMRRRSQAASNAYSPRIDLVVRELVFVGVLELDDRLDDPEFAANDAPELGRIGGEHRGEGDGGVVLAARLEDRLEIGGRDERDVARQDEDLGGVVGDRGDRGADGVAGAAGLVLEGEVGAVGEDVADGLDCRGVDDDRSCGRGASGGRPLRPKRRGRRPASGGRTAGAAPWGSRTSCACPDPPRGPRRWFGRLAQAWARDLEGSCAASGVRGAVLARAACGARRAVEECHQMEPGWYGRPAGTVKRD